VAIEVTGGLLHFLVAGEVINSFVIVCEEQNIKTDCSVLETVDTEDGEANGHGITVDTKL